MRFQNKNKTIDLLFSMTPNDLKLQEAIKLYDKT